MEKSKKTSKNNPKTQKKIQNVSKIEEKEPKNEKTSQKEDEKERIKQLKKELAHFSTENIVQPLPKLENTGKKTPLGIVIPYYENSDQARDLFKALMEKIKKQLNETENVLVLVVEDGQESLWLNSHENEKLAILRLKENKGVSAARNIGIDHFKGKCDYVGFIDADDNISDDYLKVLGNYASDGTHDLIETRVNVNGTLVENIDYDKHRNGVWGYAFKYTMLGNEKFDEHLQFNEDADFMGRVANLNKYRKVIVPAVYFYEYGRNPMSITKRYNAKIISKNR